METKIVDDIYSRRAILWDLQLSTYSPLFSRSAKVNFFECRRQEGHSHNRMGLTRSLCRSLTEVQNILLCIQLLLTTSCGHVNANYNWKVESYALLVHYGLTEVSYNPLIFYLAKHASILLLLTIQLFPEVRMQLPFGLKVKLFSSSVLWFVYRKYLFLRL